MRTELTRRERQIALMVADGLTNREIARKIALNLPAVQFHIYRLMQKIGANSRDDLKLWMAAQTANSSTAASPEAHADLDSYRDEQQMTEGKETPKEERRRLTRCSFCGKGQDQVRKIVAGPGVFICDQCVQLCNEVIEQEGPVKRLEDREGAITDLLLQLLRRDASSPELTDKQRQGAVDQLRVNNVTWTRIGEATGLSRVAAWERFSQED